MPCVSIYSDWCFSSTHPPKRFQGQEDRGAGSGYEKEGGIEDEGPIEREDINVFNYCSV